MKLDELRTQIDDIDDRLVELYLKRMEIVRQIAQVKTQTDKAINDSERENAVIYRLSNNLPEPMKLYVAELYAAIFHTAKCYQQTLMNPLQAAPKEPHPQAQATAETTQSSTTKKRKK